MILWAFATAGKPCPDLLEAASRPLVQHRERLMEMSPLLLPTLLWAVAKLLEACGGGTGDGGGRGAHNLIDDNGGVVHQNHTTGGLVLAGMMPFELLRLAAEGPLAQPERVAAMAPRGVVMSAWALAKSGVQPGVGDAQGVGLWGRSVGMFGAECVGKLCGTSHPVMGAAGRRAMATLSRALSDLSPSLGSQGLGLAVWAMSRLEGGEGALPRLASSLQSALQWQLRQVHQRGEEAGIRSGGKPITTPATSNGTIGPKALAAAAVSLARAKAISPPLLLTIAETCRYLAAPRVSAAYKTSGLAGWRHGTTAGKAAQLIWSIAAASPRHAILRGPSILAAVSHLASMVSDALLNISTPSINTGVPNVLMAPLHKTTQHAAKAIPDGQLCMFLSGCASLGLHPGEPVLQAAAAALSQPGRADTLSSHTLCELLESMAELRGGRRWDPTDPNGNANGIEAIRTVATMAVDVVPAVSLSAGRGRGGGRAVGQLVRSVAALLTDRICTQRQVWGGRDID